MEKISMTTKKTAETTLRKQRIATLLGEIMFTLSAAVRPWFAGPAL
jgi:hypothetical protein